jgi:hypothetical protein
VTNTSKHVNATLTFVLSITCCAVGATAQNCLPLIGPTDRVFGAANEIEDLMIAETDVAATTDSLMVVTIKFGGAGSQQILWAHKTLTGGSWSAFTEGLIPNTGSIDKAADPSVAHDAASGNYVCAALLIDFAGGGTVIYSIGVSRFVGGSWTPWNLIASASGSGLPALDKPFLVAGTPGEFYVTWWTAFSGGGAYGYGRSTSGGSTWTTGTTTITGFFAMQPAVAGSSKLFCAYNAGISGTKIKYRFLHGTDAVGGGINFREVLDANMVPVEIEFDHLSIDNVIPGSFLSKGTAQIAVDPSNQQDFYVCQHARTNGTANVDVYLAKISYSAGSWSAGPVTKINPDPVPCSDDHSDQFQPHITIDAEGRVHVVYYDDSAFCQIDSASTALFGVRYSRSCNGGTTWQHTLLPAPFPNTAWFDTSLLPAGHPGPLEYNGITFVDLVPGGSAVYAVFLGTDVNDPGLDDVIWALEFRF